MTRTLYADQLSVPEFVLSKVAYKRSEARAKKANRAHNRLQVLVRLLLHIVGFSCFTVAGFSVSNTVGYLAAAISCFALSWLVTSSASTDQQDSNGDNPMTR